MSDPEIPAAHRFDHEAMKTTFTLRIQADAMESAHGMARECSERLDFLESRLSRYVDGSDVSQINAMRAGQTLYLGEECYQCLRLALDAHARTGGLFDITQGARIEHRKSGASGEPPPVEGVLSLHPDAPAITCVEPGRQIDLGGIGKGFALDDLRRLLVDWGATGGLLSAGASTLLAFGPHRWPVELAGDGGSLRIGLAERALSASGTGIQGGHIIDPRGGRGGQAAAPARLWAVASGAGMADALSTALMLMSRGEMAELLAVDDGLDAVYLDDGRQVLPLEQGEGRGAS
jgi:thiamine biosynthesis lipoprotein